MQDTNEKSGKVQRNKEIRCRGMDVIGAWTVITLGNDAAILNYSTEEI